MNYPLDRESYIRSLNPVLWIPFKKRDCSKDGVIMSEDAHGRECTFTGTEFEPTRGRRFDGTDDKVIGTITEGFDDSFTIVLSLYRIIVPAVSRYLFIIYSPVLTDFWAQMALQNSSAFRVSLYDGVNNPVIDSRAEAKTGNDYQIAFVRDVKEDLLSVYVNGQLSKSGEDTTDSVPGYNQFVIGCARDPGYTSFYAGGIKEVAAYSKAFRPSQVNEYYLVTKEG